MARKLSIGFAIALILTIALAFFLFPILAQFGGPRTQDLSAMKLLASGLTMYAEGNDGHLPSSHDWVDKAQAAHARPIPPVPSYQKALQPVHLAT